jgi:hypothetical protein
VPVDKFDFKTGKYILKIKIEKQNCKIKVKKIPDKMQKYMGNKKVNTYINTEVF